MQASLIRIGNSQGVRLPKAVIEQAGLGKDLDIEVRDGAVIIRALLPARSGWAAAAADLGKDDMADLNDWDACVADGEQQL